MYQFNGTLTVRKIKGNYGEFSVGSITSPIGIFSIKQPELEQYEEGMYQGDFVIDAIFTGSSNFGGYDSNKMIFECRANLAEIAIREVDEETPVDTEVESVPSDKIETKPEPKEVKRDTDVYASNILDEEQSNNFNQKQAVILDPSIGRKKLTKQTTFLKENGYKYEATSQSWHPKT